MTDENQTPPVGRNEPCPCGSKKKYKRCCGKNAAPVLTESKKNPWDNLPPDAQQAMAQAGMDPSAMDQDAMGDMMKQFQKLPKNQMKKMQNLMQQAMSGKDVSAEMAVLEKQLPPEFKSMMGGLDAATGGADAPAKNDEMSVDEAKKLVEQAMKSGEVSKDEAEELLKAEDPKKKSWNPFKKK